MTFATLKQQQKRIINVLSCCFAIFEFVHDDFHVHISHSVQFFPRKIIAISTTITAEYCKNKLLAAHIADSTSLNHHFRFSESFHSLCLPCVLCIVHTSLNFQFCDGCCIWTCFSKITRRFFWFSGFLLSFCAFQMAYVYYF